MALGWSVARPPYTITILLLPFAKPWLGLPLIFDARFERGAVLEWLLGENTHEEKNPQTRFLFFNFLKDETVLLCYLVLFFGSPPSPFYRLDCLLAGAMLVKGGGGGSLADSYLEKGGRAKVAAAGKTTVVYRAYYAKKFRKTRLGAGFAEYQERK